jgi:sugar lactone lactonase YvrE
MADRHASVVATGVFFGEGPRWHEGELWFSDFYANAIKALAPDGTLRVAHEFPGLPSGLGWLPDGTLLAVSMVERAVLAHRDGGWVRHGDLSDIATFHANDMVVDDRGNAYVGNFGFDLDAEVEARGFGAVIADHPTASLALVRPDGSAHAVAEDLHFPNGMVVTPDGGTLIVAETAGLCLTAFTIRPDGTLTDRRRWAQLEVLPDGICLDADGGVWVAAAAMPLCIRVVEGGGVTDEVRTDAPSYACMLGGDDGRTLFVMNAPDHTAAVAAGEAKGFVSSVVVDVPRAGRP